MKKFLFTCLVSISVSQTLLGVDFDNVRILPVEDDQVSLNENIVSKEVVTVTNAAELNDAIQEAATDVHHSTTIRIKGTIIGNFTIPATVNTIRLLGVCENPTLSADGSGTTLTINLGAIVKIHHLTITGASGMGAHGIYNYGTLEISNSKIVDNTGGSGIGNQGALEVVDSFIDRNNVYGIESTIGGTVRLEKTSVSNNASTGIYLYSSRAFIERCKINENGDDGFYNYYGSELILKKSEVNQNTGYGIESDYSAKVSVDGCEVKSNSSGGIYNQGTVCLVKSSKISNNSGEGLYNYNYAVLDVEDSDICENLRGIRNTSTASLFLKNSKLLKNTIGGSGGAIYNDSSGSADISDCHFEENSANDGGAIYSEYLLSVNCSTFKENSSINNAGAIFNDTNATMIVRDSKFIENTTPGQGGGLSSNGTATVINSDFFKNTASQGGGLRNAGTLTVIDSEVKRNTATGGVGQGGGIYNVGSLTLIDTEVEKNTPDQVVGL